jgi:mono/diheme cytochrome c family protein
MVFGLATGNKIALGGMGALFIAFALVSAFVVPRRNPSFPGRNVGLYVLVTACFFLAMMATVLIFGKEEEKEAGGEGGIGITAPKTTPAEGGGEYANGDAAAGKAVFIKAAGCNSCHTLKAANATGTVGPNLDQAKPPRDLIIARVTKGKGPMPPFKGTLSDKQIADVVAFVYDSTH